MKVWWVSDPPNALTMTRHYFWAVLLGVIGIALIITSGPEIRKLWRARSGKK